jgi:hypothetical protein
MFGFLFVEQHLPHLLHPRNFIVRSSLHRDERAAVTGLTKLAGGFEGRALIADNLNEVHGLGLVIDLLSIISRLRRRDEHEAKAVQAEMPIRAIPVRVWLSEAGKEPTRCSG